MEGLKESANDKPIECPLCNSQEVNQIFEPGARYQCKMCSHKFQNKDEPLSREHDFDFPSPEDHDL